MDPPPFGNCWHQSYDYLPMELSRACLRLVEAEGGSGGDARAASSFYCGAAVWRSFWLHPLSVSRLICLCVDGSRCGAMLKMRHRWWHPYPSLPLLLCLFSSTHTSPSLRPPPPFIILFWSHSSRKILPKFVLMERFLQTRLLLGSDRLLCWPPSSLLFSFPHRLP